ncbi:hypothetical protein AWB74_02132 [Caballeronia arvi]|uniref:Uncharacterized protein n=1 Tax=Caballeronia arvi TaxID=1777135 RepID=A0A158HST1_9BURK|nr:hypothetical protein [Caballeronia arvi]SAL47435.1 hypothetical protein AWB74_02132 [Caballeronia arvi]
MILDQQSLFSDAQAITASANSSNVIDTLPGGQNTKSGIGDGEDITLFAQVGSANFATLTSLNIQLVSADDAALTTNPITHYDSGAIPVASLTAKARLVGIDVPFGKFRRYVGLKYVVTGSNATAGSITAGLVKDMQTINGTVDYAKGFTVA